MRNTVVNKKFSRLTMPLSMPLYGDWYPGLSGPENRQKNTQLYINLNFI